MLKVRLLVLEDLIVGEGEALPGPHLVANLREPALLELVDHLARRGSGRAGAKTKAEEQASDGPGRAAKMNAPVRCHTAQPAPWPMAESCIYWRRHTCEIHLVGPDKGDKGEDDGHHEADRGQRRAVEAQLVLCECATEPCRGHARRAAGVRTRGLLRFLRAEKGQSGGTRFMGCALPFFFGLLANFGLPRLPSLATAVRTSFQVITATRHELRGRHQARRVL